MDSLITGGSGFIGRNIVQMTGGIPYDLKDGFDILDIFTLEKVIRENNIKKIFHCAAKISVPESFQKEKEYFETNVRGLQNIIQIAEKYNIKIVFSSSASVYGEYNRPVREDDKLNPQSPYAENKRQGEELLKKTKLSYVILRYFNVYGGGQSKEYAGVISNFIDRALKDEDIVINGDGNQVRDFVFVEDVARANILAMNSNTSYPDNVFNVGGGKEITINELAGEIIKLTKSKSKIVYKEKREGDIFYSKANIDKIQKILNWIASTSIDRGLENVIKSIKSFS